MAGVSPSYTWRLTAVSDPGGADAAFHFAAFEIAAVIFAAVCAVPADDLIGRQLRSAALVGTTLAGPAVVLALLVRRLGDVIHRPEAVDGIGLPDCITGPAFIAPALLRLAAVGVTALEAVPAEYIVHWLLTTAAVFAFASIVTTTVWSVSKSHWPCRIFGFSHDVASTDDRQRPGCAYR